MAETYAVQVTIEPTPVLQSGAQVGRRGAAHLLFEAMSKAIGSVGGYGDGVGFARDAATEVKASLDRSGPAGRYVFTVEINEIAGR